MRILDDIKLAAKRIARARSFTIPGSNRGHGKLYERALAGANSPKAAQAAAIAYFDRTHRSHPAVVQRDQ